MFSADAMRARILYNCAVLRGELDPQALESTVNTELDSTRMMVEENADAMVQIVLSRKEQVTRITQKTAQLIEENNPFVKAKAAYETLRDSTTNLENRVSEFHEAVAGGKAQVSAYRQHIQSLRQTIDSHNHCGRSHRFEAPFYAIGQIASQKAGGVREP